jgi:hypothetical protein
MDQSHRIWQSNGSVTMWPGSWNRRMGPAALPDCPLREQVALGLSSLFSLFFAAKYQPN